MLNIELKKTAPEILKYYLKYSEIGLSASYIKTKYIIKNLTNIEILIISELYNRKQKTKKIKENRHTIYSADFLKSL